jgi:hypothetical protein
MYKTQVERATGHTVRALFYELVESRRLHCSFGRQNKLCGGLYQLEAAPAWALGHFEKSIEKRIEKRIEKTY